MQKSNVSETVQLGLCISCGICKGVCPSEGLVWKRDKGLFQPIVDNTMCNFCGICLEVCPGYSSSYIGMSEDDVAGGKMLATYNAWSLDPDIRHFSASGGVTTTLIKQLLKQGKYTIAFCLNTYNYSNQIKTEPIRSEDFNKPIDNIKTLKSRYLPVSHENALRYMLMHSEEKIIFVGTSCAIQGICKVIEKFNLERDNYLLIGLFCERVFNYNVDIYFRQEMFCDGKELKEFHFKNKESGGWPGNMKFFFQDGSETYHDKSCRMKIKEYFMPERCVYCIDKLNIYADISVGDNYTGMNSSMLGSNSVIIRSIRGDLAWNATSEYIEAYNIDIKEIKVAQDTNSRMKNLFYGYEKEKQIYQDTGKQISINLGFSNKTSSKEYEMNWRSILEKVKLGEQFHVDPELLVARLAEIDRKKEKELRRSKNIFNRGYQKLKRTIRK